MQFCWIGLQIEAKNTGAVGSVKTENSVRTVPIPDVLLTMLQKDRQIGSDYIIRAPRNGSHWSQPPSCATGG
jgi:hypothetical protein